MENKDKDICMKVEVLIDENALWFMFTWVFMRQHFLYILFNVVFMSTVRERIAM